MEETVLWHSCVHHDVPRYPLPYMWMTQHRDTHARTYFEDGIFGFHFQHPRWLTVIWDSSSRVLTPTSDFCVYHIYTQCTYIHTCGQNIHAHKINLKISKNKDMVLLCILHQPGICYVDQASLTHHSRLPLLWVLASASPLSARIKDVYHHAQQDKMFRKRERVLRFSM